MKLVLGAVQFGLDYGISNHGGQVTISEAKNILNYAKDNGIDTLDTAASYGNSEEVLGAVGVDDFQVITKTISLENDVDKVIEGFYQSLESLGQKQIKGLLVHDFSNIENKEFDVLFSKLNELKQQGLIEKIGFSTYTPEQVDFLLKNFDFDLIQAPFNVFDDRLARGGQLKVLKNNGVEVHVRSVFLQGLLLDFDSLSDYFSIWDGKFKYYQKIVQESGLSLLEYALNFALNTQEIDKVLVGVNSERQLKEIIQAVKGPSSLSAYPIDDINLLNPSLWKT